MSSMEIANQIGFLNQTTENMNQNIRDGFLYISSQLTQLNDKRTVGQHRVAALQRQSKAVGKINNLIDFIVDERNVYQKFLPEKVDKVLDAVTTELHEIKDILINNK